MAFDNGLQEQEETSLVTTNSQEAAVVDELFELLVNERARA
jgi:hypothetical protein